MNSRRYTMTSLSIVFLALTMITVSGLGQNAYAAGMSLSVDADYASGSISVSGDTDRSEVITILVKAENGNISAVAQVSPSGGSFSASLGLADMDGTYTVSAQQGANLAKYKMVVEINSSSPSGSASTIVDIDVIDERALSNKTGIAIEDDAQERFVLSATGVEGSSTIDVSGTTDRSNDITLKVIAPNGNIVSVSQITPSGGSFSVAIETGGALWTQDGMYTVSAYQGDATDAMGNAKIRAWNAELKEWQLLPVQPESTVNNITAIAYQKSVQIEILDGHVVPEFGVIAGVILAVAIASIIAVSAKSRLALVPKY